MNIIKNNGAFSILIFVFVAVIGFSNIGVDEVEAGAPADPPKNDSCKCVTYSESICGRFADNCTDPTYIKKKSVYDKKKKAYDDYIRCTKNPKKYGVKTSDFNDGYYYYCQPKIAVKKIKEGSAGRVQCITPGPKGKELEDKAKAEAEKNTTASKKAAKELMDELDGLKKEGKAHCDKWTGVCAKCKTPPTGGEDPFPIIIFTWPFHRLSDAAGS